MEMETGDARGARAGVSAAASPRPADASLSRALLEHRRDGALKFEVLEVGGVLLLHRSPIPGGPQRTRPSVRPLRR